MERRCLAPHTDSVSRESTPFNQLDKKERIMGKGNNSQKNDKKNKKVKKDAKK